MLDTQNGTKVKIKSSDKIDVIDGEFFVNGISYGKQDVHISFTTKYVWMGAF